MNTFSNIIHHSYCLMAYIYKISKLLCHFSLQLYFCRLYLAAMHYNENADREQATTSAGQPVFKVVFPKSRKGEVTARPVKTDPTYSKF